MAQDGTYFVSKKDLLQWINSTLELNITKIEQVGIRGKAFTLLLLVSICTSLLWCQACRHYRKSD